MTARSIIIVLIVLFVGLQYKLWIAHDGISQTIRLNKRIASQLTANQVFIKRNKMLAAQINELKSGTGSIQDLARDELGMIEPGETYYQFVR